MRQAALFLTAVLPGFAAVVVSGYYLFQDWAALISAFARFEQAVARGADARTLMIAQTLDSVYRINCFADGVGVMLGAILCAIGVHGLCTLPPRPTNPEAASLTGPLRWGKRLVGPLLAVLVTVATLALLASLTRRVGETNALRRAVVRGDVAAVRKQIAQGVNVNDRLWWGTSTLAVARRAGNDPAHQEVVRILEEAGARE